MSKTPTSTPKHAKTPKAAHSGAAPELATALDGLPQRVRVHELARRAGLTSKEAIAALADAGVAVGSASSSVDREAAEALLTALLGGAGGDQPAPAGAGEASDSGAGESAESGDEQAAESGDGSSDGGRSGRRRRRGGRGRRGSAKGKDQSPDHAEDPSQSQDGGSSPDQGTGEGRGKARAKDTATGKDPQGKRHDQGAAERAEGDGAGDEASDDTADRSASADEASAGDASSPDAAGDGEKSGSRRRRRRRRRSGSSEGGQDESATDNQGGKSRDVQGVKGSTRLEAKRQRRRDSRDSRRRPQILSEAEFLARRESVDRVMAVRQRGDLAQVALLEDGVLVEHFVSRSGTASMIGNVYLGRVQNVLPSMEAAFVDIGRGRNAVLYAGEVNWDIAGLEGKERRIETALSSGDSVLVQVSKDPIGHKGARLTTQISLPGRFLVYVPGGGATGISRKLPDTERKRLKKILDRIVPADAGVIIRTAAEGVGEDELAGDVQRLKTQWEEISAASEKAKSGKSSGPTQLYAEPDTLIKVIRDLFNSDINRLLIDGDEAWESVSTYVLSVAPELADRVSRYVGDKDVFAAFRVDEQISKALQRKVHLPSGGSLVIDRTEAMTVVDVNTGKFTGSGGNLEETVTRNNVEAAEEIVRQLRLRDIGGIIVVDFIDMVLESNRELVLRRLTECLGRDRTRHQVAEVTSLGLVQMTRKRMGLGLVEAFSEPCAQCSGRGIVLHETPADTGATESDGAGGGERAKRKGRKRGRGRDEQDAGAKYEPLVVERVTADAKPDPRGPKPPALFRSDPAADARASEPGGDEEAAEDPAHDPAPAPTAEATGESTGEAAGESTSEAASPGEPTGEPTGARTEGTSGDDAPAASTGAGEPSAKPTRRRRAAGRPAGAPAVASTAVDIVLPAAPEPGSGDGGAETAASDAEPAPTKPRRRRAATRAAGPVGADAEPAARA